jgi:hypothetical protein
VGLGGITPGCIPDMDEREFLWPFLLFLLISRRFLHLLQMKKKEQQQQ